MSTRTMIWGSLVASLLATGVCAIIGLIPIAGGFGVLDVVLVISLFIEGRNHGR